MVPVAATHDAAAPTTAADGRVKLQASAIRPAPPQCTEPSRRPAPAPKIEPVHTCVVDNGRPRWVEARITAALVVSALKPWTGWMSLTRLPRVRMIRQPPMYVPSPIADPAATTTQDGGGEPGASMPAVIRVNVITPMVFCASLVPWARASFDAETRWPTWKPRVTRPGSARAVTRRAR